MTLSKLLARGASVLLVALVTLNATGAGGDRPDGRGGTLGVGGATSTAQSR